MISKIVFLLTFLLTVTISAFSQEFDGIKIDGLKGSFVKAMRAKGYSVKSDKGSTATFIGNTAHPTLILTAFFSPVTKLTWKLVVYLPKQILWKDLKNQYNQYLDLLVEKYGEPSNNYGFFSTPYSEGDGNEMAAIKMDKCTFTASWTNPEVKVEITKFTQVTVRYVNSANSVIDEKEKSN